jgi:hypothetical protein
MAVGGVSSRLDATVDELSREAAAMKHAAKVFGTSAVIIDHVRLR